MSIAETLMSVNSQGLSVPLNHLIWLNDYKTYGEDSYVFQDKNILYELYEDFCLSANDKSINANALQFILSSIPEDIGHFFGSIYGVKTESNTIVDWSAINSISDLIENEIALNYVLNSNIGRSLLIKCASFKASDEPTMEKYCSSRPFLLLLYENYKNSDVKSFLSSQHLLNAAQNSPFYEVGMSNEPIELNNVDARRIHYNGKVLLLGVSQMISNGVGYTYVDTLEGTAYARPSTGSTYGNTGLIYRLNNFASTAQCHPEYYYADSATLTAASYMAYLKLE